MLGGVIQAYKVSALARYRDAARFVVKSLSDEFMIVTAQEATGAPRPLFEDTGDAYTGVGLTWNGVTGTADGLPVTLVPSSGRPISALVTRKVRFVGSTGSDASAATETSAGFLVRAEFKITYSVLTKPQPPLAINVVRSIP